MSADGIQNQYSRAEIAEALEISGNQILQYQERSLLADRPANAQDIAYNSLDVARLRFILRCEAAGYKGDEVFDFVGKVNKDASIKDQVKASLVHAHQKFSYVNAQKRKADILEQVNLQADADLIKNYIDEMKEVLANPKVSLISKTNVKQRPIADTKTERIPSPAPESDQSSRLKTVLNRSHRPVADPKQPPQIQSNRPITPRRPTQIGSKKSRSKFIDSSIASNEYDQNISDTPQDMFIDYSRPNKSHSKAIKYKDPRRSRSSAWKQTLFTFLLLSLFSIAGYAFYMYKFQNYTTGTEPASLNNFSASDNLDPEIVHDNSTTQKNDTPLAPTTKPSDSSIKTKADENLKKTPDSNDSTATTPTPPSHQTPKDSISTVDPNSYPTKKKDSTSPPPPTPTEPGPAGSSLSDTAMKDLDDLLAKKQAKQQSSTEEFAPSERPQVAVYDFKLFFQASRKILVAKFKIARIRPQRNLIQGRLFVVFKPRESAQNSKYFSVPDAKIVDGVPSEPLKGIEFSFTGSTKVQSVRSIYVRDPSEFEVATVFVFSNSGELVLIKNFTVTVTEY
jgi:DNA-binding transcriptional MerR regulator